MTRLTADVLKQICDNLPDDYLIAFVDENDDVHYVSDVFSVVVSGERLLLKS